jgi:predicted Kef-type K+ transport protein
MASSDCFGILPDSAVSWVKRFVTFNEVSLRTGFIATFLDELSVFGVLVSGLAALFFIDDLSLRRSLRSLVLASNAVSIFLDLVSWAIHDKTEQKKIIINK